MMVTVLNAPRALVWKSAHIVMAVSLLAACEPELGGASSAAQAPPRAVGETADAVERPETDPDVPSDRASRSVAGSFAPPRADDAGTPPPPPPPNLFDPDTIPHFELGFDAAAMAVLTSVAKEDEETWVHATFKMGKVAYADVGVRRKGSSTFRALPGKASFKVKLNKYVKGQKLYGLTDLTLNNQVSSGNFLSERLAYHVFGALGLPAPRANSARVSINGEDYGLYLNVETPGSKLLERLFGAKGKTLYEAEYGGDWAVGNEGTFEIDVADPAAPAGSRPDLTALFATVAAAKDETLLADVATRLHTTEWLRFSATEAFVAHWDGYAFNDGPSKNYFLAGDADGKFVLLPWSTDLTFPMDHARVDASLPTSATLLARCKRTTACWSAYQAEAKWVLAEVEKLDLEALAKKWHGQIDPLVLSDPKRETSIEWYEQRTKALYEFIRTRPAVIGQQLALGI